MSEDLTYYLAELGIRVRYLHSDIDTVERMEIIRDLRLGVFDVLVFMPVPGSDLDVEILTVIPRRIEHNGLRL